MITKVQRALSVRTKSPSNMSQTPAQPRPSSQTQQHNNVTQTSTHQATGTKKKKKKKNTSTLVSNQGAGATEGSSQTSGHDSNAAGSSQYAASSSGASSSLDRATTEQWQQRVQSLRTAFSKAQKENQLLTADLAAALARASDAEHAEDTVNKGLLTARSVISQRDRTIAELKSTASNLRAELTTLQEEKKKTDKRLILLKTVSVNLQEAREARDGVEKKLEDANREICVLKEQNARLSKAVDSLKQHAETMEMVKQQLARREIEIDELSRAKHSVEEEAHHGELRAFGVGVTTAVAIGVIMRVLGKGRAKDEE